MSINNPGRIRWRLADMLQALGFHVTAYDIWEQQGEYRKLRGAEGASWGAYQHNPNDPQAWYAPLHSFNTMTECVKNGITVDRDGTDLCVCANEPPKADDEGSPPSPEGHCPDGLNKLTPGS